jgi:hypothetical protein
MPALEYSQWKGWIVFSKQNQNNNIFCTCGFHVTWYHVTFLNSYVKALTPIGTTFGDWTIKEVKIMMLQYNWCPYKKMERHKDRHMQRKSHMKTERKWSSARQGQSTNRKPNLPTLCSIFSLELWEITLLHRHPVCDCFTTALKY